MKSFQKASGCAIALALAAWGCPSSILAGPYKLRIVVQSGDLVDGHNLNGAGGPAFNDNGDIAYEGGLFADTPETEAEGLVMNDEFVVATGDVIGGKSLQVLGEIAMNNNREVVFLGVYDDGSLFGGPVAVFTPDRIVAGPGMTIGGKDILRIRQAPDINDNGSIVFVGTFQDGEGIFVNDQLVVQTGDTIDGKTLTSLLPGVTLLKPSFNDNADIAFRAGFAGGEGIFTQNALIAATGDIIDGKQVTRILGAPTINNRGDIVFQAIFSDGGSGLFLNDSLLVVSGDTIGGKTITRMSFTGTEAPSVNDFGEVAFGASIGDDSRPGVIEEAIFTTNHLVAATGDRIDGLRLITVNTPVINNRGDIVFDALLSDGSTPRGAVILADFIPEPTCGGLALIAAALVLLYYIAISRIRAPRGLAKASSW